MAISAEQRKFSVVVAVCKNSRGIGNAGQLPWRLRADMQYFKQLTRSTRDPTKRNAVIMGRKTWLSIPSKFRPLDDRVNVVLSRNPEAAHDLELPAGVLVAPSMERALELLDERSEVGAGVENVYVIGGASVYSEALSLRTACAKVLVTEIERVADGAPAPDAGSQENAGNTPPVAEVAGDKAAAVRFECDTFFPPLDDGAYGKRSLAPAKVENGLRYEFVEFVPRGALEGGPVADVSDAAPAPAHEEDQYLDLVREVIEHGTLRHDRTGVGTLSKFGVQMRFDLSEKFPLLTTKSVFWRGVAEVRAASACVRARVCVRVGAWSVRESVMCRGT